MFKWYANAEVCYAYLSDVLHLDGFSSSDGITASRWFTRGWTLQELIAPKRLSFLDRDSKLITARKAVASQISIQTGIDIDNLREDTSNLSFRLETLSVAQRMSWAADRRTSRQEDRAYSLLGLFNVNMPLLYGEDQKAFTRLHHEIMEQAVDLSILAWSHRCPQEKAKGLQLLAMTPDDFADCRSMILDNEGIDRTSVEVEIISSSRGIRVTAPVSSRVSKTW